MLPTCTKGQIGGINASPVLVLQPWGERGLVNLRFRAPSHTSCPR